MDVSPSDDSVARQALAARPDQCQLGPSDPAAGAARRGGECLIAWSDAAREVLAASTGVQRLSDRPVSSDVALFPINGLLGGKEQNRSGVLTADPQPARPATPAHCCAATRPADRLAGCKRTVGCRRRHAAPACGGGWWDPSKRSSARRKGCGMSRRGQVLYVALPEPPAHTPAAPHLRAARAGHPDLKRIAYDTPISAV